MRIVNTIPQADLATCGAAAAALEAQGYDGLVTLENRHDPFLPLALAATTTQRIELATGIALAFVRSPMSTAHIAWDLQAASQGRFVLGLGPQIRAHNERRYSVAWTPPVPRLREYVGALRAIWQAWRSGDALQFEGEHYRFTLMPPNFVPEPIAHSPPPITLAAVGPAMLRLAGEVADGVRLHPLCTRTYFERTVLPNLEHGFTRGRRQRAAFEINGGGFIATGADDAAVARQLEWVRRRIGFYASTPAYWPVLEAEGLPDLGPHLNALTRRGAWDRLAAEVPDGLLHACAAVGRHDQIVERIEARFGGLVDTLQVSAAYDARTDLPAALLPDLARLPTAFTGFRT